MRSLLTVFLLALAVAVVHGQVMSDIIAMQCTANDMQVMGSGIVTNEPCGCTGTFTANVSFVINNSANAARYCATMYLCDGSLFRQLLVPAVVPGKTANTYTVQIPNYPCNSGLQCYGAGVPNAPLGSVFPKGAACPTGQCCDTVLWNQNSGNECPDATPIASQCRHQQICIQAKSVNLTCVSGCTPGNTCGPYFATVKVCHSGLSAGPYFYYVSDDMLAKTRTSSNSCETFQVEVNHPSEQFTAYVQDSSGCKTYATPITLTSNPSLSMTLGSFVASGCGASGTFTAAAIGGAVGSTKTYSFKVDNGAAVTSTTGVFNYPGNTDGTCHTVSASVVDSNGCTAGPVTRKITQCVTTTECA